MTTKREEFLKILEGKTISSEEMWKHFTPEQNHRVEAGVRKYDLLVKLRKLRKKAKLTQAQLAKKADLPRTTITKIESGEYNPTINTLMSIASAMDKQLKVDFV